MMTRPAAFVLALLLAGALQPASAQTAPPPPPELVTPPPLPSATPLPSASPSPLSATPQNVRSNVGNAAAVTIAGATLPIAATLDPKIAAVTVNGAGITLAPLRNGTATLHVTDAANASIDIPVRIAPNAGTIAPNVTVKVTGPSVDPAFIAQQAALALGRATLALPGATVTTGTIPAPALPLGPNGQSVFAVPVTIAGGADYLDVAGTTQVSVQNVPAAPFEPETLWYSDDPERLTADGVLFRGSIARSAPVRIYDYHENGPQRRRLVVMLSSDDTSPATLQIVEAFAGPNADVMSVGHAVTRTFLTNKPRNQGLIYDLGGGAPLYLRDLNAGPREGIATATDFNLIAGGPVTLTVLAVSPGVNPATLANGPVLPGDGKDRKGTFRLAGYGSQTLTYAAGGADASAAIGDREPALPPLGAAAGHDYGDYGVLFEFDLVLSNPTGAPATAYLYESPRGGPARAAYLLDGRLVELGCAAPARSATDPPHRYQIGEPIVLAPGETQHHVVRTMTDGGSNLPIEIGITAAAPQPTTPPISAPDGCFPKP